MDMGIIFPYLETYGGAQIFALECLKRWKKENDLTLYSVNINKKLFENYDLDFNIIEIDIPYKNQLMNFPLLLQHKIASKYISKHEIYNSHMFPCHSLDIENNIWIPQEPSRILYDLKFLMNNENISKKVLYNISTPFLRYIDKKTYKAEKTIANSNYSKKYLENIYDIKINDVVYPGVDIKKFNNNKTKKEANQILIVSRLYKEKNIDIGIKALKLLNDSYTMKIVGSGPYKKELENLSKKLGLTERIKFLDFVDDENLVSLYKEALCVIFMPFKEPFGMVALESLAAGTPVIGLKNGGGYTELIEDNINGFLVENNPYQIAQKISSIRNNDTEYKLMIKNCKSTANEYTWDNTADKLMKIFENYLQ